MMLFDLKDVKQTIIKNRNSTLLYKENDILEFSYLQNIIEHVNPNIDKQEGYYWSIFRQEKPISLLTPIHYLFNNADWKLIYQNQHQHKVKEVDIENKVIENMFRYIPRFNSKNKIWFFLPRSLGHIRNIRLKHIDIQQIKFCTLYANNRNINTISTQTLQLYNQNNKQDFIVLPFFQMMDGQFFPIGLDKLADWWVEIICVDDHIQKRSTCFHNVEFCVETLTPIKNTLPKSLLFEIPILKIVDSQIFIINNHQQIYNFSCKFEKLAFLVFSYCFDLDFIDKIQINNDDNWCDMELQKNDNKNLVISFDNINNQVKNLRIIFKGQKHTNPLFIPIFFIEYSSLRYCFNSFAENKF